MNTRAPKDIPIIFSAPMVRALLDGRKTMTRRLALSSRKIKEESGPGFYRSQTKIIPSPWRKVQAGDRLWVRENWRPASWDEDCQFWIEYPADGTRSTALHGEGAEDLCERVCDEMDKKGAEKDEGGWYKPGTQPRTRPSIHMPRWVSRLTLVVTATKIERLQNISEEDAAAEGLIKLKATSRYVVAQGEQYLGFADRSAKKVFAYLWDSLHGEGEWDANPEVVALSFTVHKSNIDALPKSEAA